MTDNPFINFAFAASGGTALRTMPARLNDTINALDIAGVDPTGVADSTTGLRNALHAAANLGVASSSGQKGGTLYLPPGSYKVTDVIFHDIADSTVAIVGAGKYATTIFGTVNTDFLIRIGDVLKIYTKIEDIGFVNNSTNSASGAAKLPYLDACTIRNCYFKGFVGLDFGDNTFNSAAYNCDFEGPGYSLAGSIAVSMGQCGLYNCRASNAETGIAWWNGGGIVAGCYVEHCSVGIYSGLSYTSVNDANTAFSFHATTVNECTMGVRYTASSGGITTGLKVQGAVGPDGVTPPQYGIYCDTLSYHTAIGVEVTAVCSIAGINIVNYPNQAWINCTSTGSVTNWVIPAVYGFTFIGCDNPAYVLTFAALPSAAGAEGATYNISDSNTATWGATAAGGGANHVKVRSNKTVWTVVGK